MLIFVFGLRLEADSNLSWRHLHICYPEEFPRMQQGIYKVQSAMELAPYKQFESIRVRLNFTREVADSIDKISE